MVLIDGKKVSGQIRKRLAEEVQELKKKTGKTPGLATVLVGDDPASAVYVRNKNKICGELIEPPQSITSRSASILSTIPLLLTSTPIARFASNITR